MIGDVLSGRYRVTRLLGRGGMSAVWLARDDVLDRDVAVKMLHIRRLESAEAVERFEREARTLASLTHPGIVTVIDRGDDHGRPFIVFEYVRGRDLRERIADEGRLPLMDVLAIGEQVADALAYAHARGVIHRDVKPHNILLTPDGQPKLTDFGIARVLEQPGLTMEGRVLGTGDYLAPEQAAGEPLDVRADVYALGVLLYHALVGEVPFHADTYLETARLHANAPIPSVRDVRPELPERLDEIIRHALAKRPDDRYADCGELRDDLRALAVSLGGGDEDTDEYERAPREPTVLVTGFELPPLPAPTAVPSFEPLSSIPEPPRRGLRIASIALLVFVLAIGGGVAAYIIHAQGDSDAATTSAPTTGPTTQPVGTTPSSPTAAKPVLKPLKLAAATSYDPEGDGSENQYLAPLAVDADPTTAWKTETYKSSDDNLAGKHGVGLVLDAGQAVSARSLKITTLAPGWRAQVLSTRAASIPAQIDGWSAISSTFVMNSTTRSISLSGPTARFFLIWITKLTGEPTDWSATIANASLYAATRQ